MKIIARYYMLRPPRNLYTWSRKALHLSIITSQIHSTEPSLLPFDLGRARSLSTVTTLRLGPIQERQQQELVEQGRPQPGDRIPAFGSIPPGSDDLGRRQAGILARGAAPAASALRDIREAAGRPHDAVQPRVQEAERAAAAGDERVVDEGDDPRERGRRRRGAANRGQCPVLDHAVVVGLRRDVGESAARGVVVTGEALGAENIQIRGDGGVLVRGAGEVVAEAAGREGGGLLGQHGGGAADRGDVGAGAGEGRREARRLVAVVGLARRARPRVARREEDAHAAGAQLADHGAHLLRVGDRDLALVVAVRGRQGRRQLGVRHVQQVGEELQIGLVGVLIRVWLAAMIILVVSVFIVEAMVDSLQIGDQRSTSSNRIETDICVVPQSRCVLDV